jgi:hypothetical protein
LDSINSDNITFGSRINNTVHLNTNIKSEGEVQIMYFLDKKSFALDFEAIFDEGVHYLARGGK